MRILVVCNKPPYPTVDGGCRAMASMLEALHSLGHHISCLVFSTDKHPYQTTAIPAHLREINWTPVYLDTKITALHATVHLLTGRSYILDRFVDKAVEEQLERLLLEPFDLAHLESLFALPYAARIKEKGIPVVYRAHNIEHLIWRGTATQTKGLLKRAYLRREAKLLQQQEMTLIAQSTAIMAITPTDCTWLQHQFPTIPCRAIPTAIDIPANHPQPSSLVYHLGAMDWLPNQEAIRWLLDAIWPLVIEQLPTAQLHIAGKAMPDWIRQLPTTGVTIEGYIPQADSYIADKGILAVPLLSGSGLRIKILEAMAYGKAVITTSKGVEGIAATHGKEVWIADDAAAFAAGLIRLITDADLRNTLAENGQKLIEDQYAPPAIQQAVADLYENLLMS